MGSSSDDIRLKPDSTAAQDDIRLKPDSTAPAKDEIRLKPDSMAAAIQLKPDSMVAQEDGGRPQHVESGFSRTEGFRATMGAWLDGWRRVADAPAVIVAVFTLTLAIALPLAMTLRDALQAHLGRSLVAAAAAEHVDYDWWQEFAAQASGLGSTFAPVIIGFAATLDNLSRLLDGQAEILPITSALALYLTGWAFISGGIIDRYARQRRTRTHGFFAASGVYFFRFLRLAAIAGLFYWWMFGAVHPWLFDEWYPRLTRNVSIERDAFAIRALLYLAFGALLLLGNLLFDYVKVRAVVEDRRSMFAALTAALRFISNHPGRTFGLYALNAVVFAVVLAIWAMIAPGAGGAGAAIWLGFAVAQMYVLVRLLLKLHFIASQTALFQASLAHARYTAAPIPAWPESPLAEALSVPRPDHRPHAGAS